VIVCTLTALVVIITGVYLGGTPLLDEAIANSAGACDYSAGFGSVVELVSKYFRICNFS